MICAENILFWSNFRWLVFALSTAGAAHYEITTKSGWHHWKARTSQWGTRGSKLSSSSPTEVVVIDRRVKGFRQQTQMFYSSEGLTSFTHHQCGVCDWVKERAKCFQCFQSLLSGFDGRSIHPKYLFCLFIIIFVYITYMKCCQFQDDGSFMHETIRMLRLA